MYNIQGSYERERFTNTFVKPLKKQRERFTNTTANPSKKPSKKPTNLPTVKPTTFGDEEKVVNKNPYGIFGGKDKYCTQRNKLLTYSIKSMQEVEKHEIHNLKNERAATRSYDNFKHKIEVWKKSNNIHKEIRMHMPGFDGQKLGECTQKKTDQANKFEQKLGDIIGKNLKEEEKCKKAKGPLSPYQSCDDKNAKEMQYKFSQKIMMIGGGLILVLILYFVFLRKK